MARDRQDLSDVAVPELQLKLALQTTEALAQYARAEHLIEADELLAGFLALLLAHGSTNQHTG